MRLIFNPQAQSTHHNMQQLPRRAFQEVGLVVSGHLQLRSRPANYFVRTHAIRPYKITCKTILSEILFTSFQILLIFKFRKILVRITNPILILPTAIGLVQF